MPILGEESLLWAQAYFGRRKPTLGAGLSWRERSLILGKGLFLEREAYFWSIHLRRQKNNMQRKKEKQLAEKEEKPTCK
jgi:hypothetical protein